MAEELVTLLREQIEQQKAQMDQLANHQDAQIKALVECLKDMGSTVPAPVRGMPIPSFHAFDDSSELWSDYWERFQSFVGANSVPEEKQAQTFLTNQSAVVYKMLQNLASQQSPPKEINKLSMEEIAGFMKIQYDPKRFVIRERFKFWSDMNRKPGESIPELAARIRQDAVNCDFQSIRDPLDEALRTRFICSVNNEAVLKALFKVKEDELSFEKAVKTAVETEDAAKVAKKTVYGSKPTFTSQANTVKTT